MGGGGHWGWAGKTHFLPKRPKSHCREVPPLLALLLLLLLVLLLQVVPLVLLLQVVLLLVQLLAVPLVAPAPCTPLQSSLGMLKTSGAFFMLFRVCACCFWLFVFWVVFGRPVGKHQWRRAWGASPAAPCSSGVQPRRTRETLETLK